MRSIIYPTLILVFAFVAGFVFMSGTQAQRQAVPVNLINGFELNLEKNDEGKCVLLYRKASPADAPVKKVAFDMSAPCEFVRLDDKLRSYAYGKRGKRYHSVIIVGGKPDAESKDALMPGGCGTEFVAVSVFSSGIKTSDKINAGSRICPTEGLDEKYFNFYAKP